MIKAAVKRFVKSHNLANILYQVHLLRIDEQTTNWFADLNLADVLKFEHLGPENPDRNLYLIEKSDYSAGFFWLWKAMLQRIDYAEKYNLTPVMIWGEKTVYKDPNGNPNPFEDYFQPLSGISAESALHSANVVRPKWNLDGTWKLKTSASYDLAGLEKDLDRYVELQKKYVRLQPQVEEQIQGELRGLLQGKKTLAVHIRGVEWGNIKGHPIPVGLEAYMQLIDAAVEQHGFQQIFLATDSDDTVAAMRRRYGESLVCFQDVARAKAGSHTLVIFDQQSIKETSPFRMGYEVLRDMMALAESQGLIAGLSNISLAARVWKKAADGEYEYLHMIQNQIQTKGIQPAKATRQMRGGQ